MWILNIPEYRTFTYFVETWGLCCLWGSRGCPAAVGVAWRGVAWWVGGANFGEEREWRICSLSVTLFPCLSLARPRSLSCTHHCCEKVPVELYQIVIAGIQRVVNNVPSSSGPPTRSGEQRPTSRDVDTKAGDTCNQTSWWDRPFTAYSRMGGH